MNLTGTNLVRTLTALQAFSWMLIGIAFNEWLPVIGFACGLCTSIGMWLEQ